MHGMENTLDCFPHIIIWDANIMKCKKCHRRMLIIHESVSKGKEVAIWKCPVCLDVEQKPLTYMQKKYRHDSNYREYLKEKSKTQYQKGRR